MVTYLWINCSQGSLLHICMLETKEAGSKRTKYIVTEIVEYSEDETTLIHVYGCDDYIQPTGTDYLA